MTNSTRCILLAKQACTTLSHVVQKITPPSANNFFKLFFALFAILTLGVGNAWGAEEETLACPQGTISNKSMKWSLTSCTILHEQAASTTAIAAYTPWRIYKSSTVTFTPNTDITISKIVITVDNSKTDYVNATKNGTWSNASIAMSSNIATVTPTDGTSSIKFTSSSAQTRWSSITVTYEAGSTTQKQKYTLTYQAGSVTGSLEVEEGANLLDALKDITPVACDPTSTEPIGWSESEITTKQADAPTLLTDADVMPSEAHSVYYVFAKKETTGGGEATEKTGTYTFSSYAAGTQYAKNEEHKLDDNVTIYTNDCHFTSELRIYSSSSNNGYVVSNELPGKIVSMDFNAGNKVDILVVSGSTDGSTWNQVGEVSVTSTSYKDYTLSFGETNYTYFKLDVKGANQVRLKKMSVTYMSGGGTTTISDYITSCGSAPDVIVRTLKSIAVTGMKQEFVEGDEFTFDGTCTATYSVTKNDVPQEDEKETVTPTVSAPNMTKIGEQTVTVSYTDGEVTAETSYTINITEKPKYTITWSINGGTKTLSPSSVAEGDALGTLPTLDPSDICTGKVFVGWTTEANKDYTHATDAPELITKDTKPSRNITYYAVFATGEDQTTSIAGGEWPNGATSDWKTSGTGTYSGNGVKFDDANDYVMSPNISSKGYTRLLLKFKSGYNGNQGSILTFYTYNQNNALLTDENVTISPKTVMPEDTYTKQTKIYEVNISANEVIGYIAIKMTDRTSNLGMSYCEIFGVSTSYSNYSTTCVSETDLSDAQFAWSAATATALKGADNNEFPTLTNTISVPVTYSSSKEEVATIAADGKITLLAPGTTTISAKFAGGEVSGTKYAAKTVTYTLTVKQLVSCADIYNLADNATFVLKEFVVTYVNGDYTYIKDDAGYGLIFTKDASDYDLKAGDKVASGKFEGKKTTYRTLVEIIPITACGDLNAISVEAPAPDVLNTNPTTDNINQYVNFEKVSFDADKFNSSKSINGTIEGQSIAIKFYNQFAIEKTFDISKKYSVVGIVSIYENNIQVYFISAEEVEEPTLNVEITNADFGKIAINNDAERTLTLNGSLLTKPVSLAIEGEGAEHFKLSSYSVDPTDGNITNAKITITYKPTAEGTHTPTLKITSDEVAEQITLTGQAAQQYTVHFFVNDEEQTELAKKVLSGNTLEEIPTATSCDPLEYPTFIGWSASEITGTTDVEPTDLLDLNTTITADCKYYAVFAKEISSTISTGITYEVTLKNTNFVTNYDERTINITANEVGGDGTVEVSFQSVGVMKCTDASKGAVMQFRKKNSSSQPGIIYNTTDLGQINSITIGTRGTNNIASIVIGSTQQPTTQEDNEGFFLITNGTSVSYIPSITINFTQNSSASTTTYTYLTTCESATPTYTVTYNLDGGESTCETSVVVEQDGELTLCDAPTKTGHKFLKWKDQNDHEYAAGAKITVSVDLTLTAQWQVNSYEVTWMSLGEEVESNSADYNTQPTKPTTAPSYTCGIGSKEFVGWTTQEIDGVGVPANLYTDEFPVVTEAITYHAVFASINSSAESTTHTLTPNNSWSGYQEGTITDDKGYTWSYCAAGTKTEGVYSLNLRNKDTETSYIGSPLFTANVKSIKATIVNGSETKTRSVYVCSAPTLQPTTGDLGITEVAGGYSGELSLAFEGTISQFYLQVSDALQFQSIVVEVGADPYTDYTTSCPVLDLTEGENTLTNGVTADVKVNRSFTANLLYTLSLPFALDAEQVKEIFGDRTTLCQFAQLTKENGELVLYFSKPSAIAAATPYLIIPAQDVNGFEVENVTICTTPNNISFTVGATTVTMKPILSTEGSVQTNGTTEYWLAADKYLYKNANTILSLRALFDITTSVPGMPPRCRVAFGENVETGIDNITSGENTTIKVIENGQLIIIRNGEKFNAQGQKL